jgi:hypothetical protein
MTSFPNPSQAAVEFRTCADRRGSHAQIRRHVEQAAVPMPARTETYNLLNRFGKDQVFAADLLRRVDVGHRWRSTERIFQPSAGTLINRQLALTSNSRSPTSLPKVVRARAGSCRLRFPCWIRA